MENKMEELARLIGLELEEEFTLDNRPIKYKLTKDGLKYWNVNIEQWDYSCGVEVLFIGKRQIVKIPKPILNEKEKEYLSAVVKPFKDKVVSIAKYRYSDDNSYIQITVEQIAFDGEFIDLPRFKSDTMYKGMRAGKRYTLEELEL